MKKHKPYAMMMVLYLSLSYLMSPLHALQQNNFSLQAQAIDALEIIEELIQPQYGGRLAGTPENERAAQYIEAQFHALGLETAPKLEGYRQPFKMNVAIPKDAATLEVTGEDGHVIKQYELLKDFMPQLNLGGRLSGEDEGEMISVEKLSDLIDHPETYKDKVVVLSYGELSRNTMMLRQQFKEKGSAIRKITGMMIGMPTRAGEQDHPYAFAISPATLDLSEQNQDHEAPIHMFCTPEVMGELMAFGETSEKEKLRMTIDYNYSQVTPSNVVGIIPGQDPVLKDQHIIISAHFDHVGDNKDGSYNPGALDNSSGTGAMLAIAKAIKNNPTPPSKTIVFVAFNGEEEGLYGSKYFVENPPFSMTPQNTICINLDMIGSANMELLNIYSNRITTPLSEVLMKLAQEKGMNVTYDTGNGSDHHYFNQAGYDSVTLINPDLESGYHTPADTREDVNPKALQEAIDLVISYLKTAAYLE